jgi:RNA polymerase sigma-70 factor (ECF subfamily)
MVLSRIRAGEREAFETLVSETWEDLVDYLSWILGSREAAEDACQDAFVRLWEQRERWHDGCARALLFRIARNLAFDAKRRERVRRAWALREAANGSDLKYAGEQVETSELELRFHEALAALTPARRETVESVRLQGLTHEQAAKALGVSQQTIANRMTLALADLRLLLGDVLPEAMARRPGTARWRGRVSSSSVSQLSTGTA